MKLKTILLMCIMLASIFVAIYISTIYNGFVAPYLIGFFTPIIVTEINNIDIKKLKK